MENSSSNLNTTTSNGVTLSLDNALPEWTYTVQIVFIAIVAAVGIPGNSLVAIVQFKNGDKSSTDYLVLTMALFELLCSSVNSVLYILRNLHLTWKLIASEFLCRTHYFTINATSMSCTLLLTAIALDRYMQTCRPFSTRYGRTKAKLVCILVAVGSIICASPALFTATLDTKTLACYIETSSNPITVGLILHSMIGVAFFLMFIVVIVSYFKITLMLRQRYQQKVVAKFFRITQTDARTSSDQTRIYPIPSRNQVKPEAESITERNDALIEVNKSENTMNFASLDEQVTNEQVFSKNSSCPVLFKPNASKLNDEITGHSPFSDLDVDQSGHCRSTAPCTINVLAYSPIKVGKQSGRVHKQSDSTEQSSLPDNNYVNKETTNERGNRKSDKIAEVILTDNTYDNKETNERVQRKSNSTEQASLPDNKYASKDTTNEIAHRKSGNNEQGSLPGNVPKGTTNRDGREQQTADTRPEKKILERVEIVAQQRLFKEEKKLNRTTLIMFLITVTYILSWLTHWLVFGIASKDTVSGRMALQLAQTSFMINCMTNPVFYICMSSAFRKNAKQLFYASNR